MRTADFVVERQVDDLADADNKKFVATKRRYVAVRTCIRVKLHLNFFYVKMKFHVNSISTLSTHLEVQLHWFKTITIQKNSYHFEPRQNSDWQWFHWLKWWKIAAEGNQPCWASCTAAVFIAKTSALFSLLQFCMRNAANLCPCFFKKEVAVHRFSQLNGTMKSNCHCDLGMKSNCCLANLWIKTQPQHHVLSKRKQLHVTWLPIMCWDFSDSTLHSMCNLSSRSNHQPINIICLLSTGSFQNWKKTQEHDNQITIARFDLPWHSIWLNFLTFLLECVQRLCHCWVETLCQISKIVGGVAFKQFC